MHFYVFNFCQYIYIYIYIYIYVYIYIYIYLYSDVLVASYCMLNRITQAELDLKVQEYKYTHIYVYFWNESHTRVLAKKIICRV